MYCEVPLQAPCAHSEAVDSPLTDLQKDYTKGSLDELIDVIIEGGAKIFVSAVGVPPKRVVDRLHEAGILYMVRLADLWPLVLC